MHRAARVACLLSVFACAPAFAEGPTLLQKSDHWTAYTSSSGPKACFVVSEPVSKAPPGVRRGPVYFYITRYPADQVPNEISIKMGYPFSAGATVTVTVDSQKFTLFTKDEGAFAETRAIESQIVTAMKAGTSMTVQGTSSRGTVTTDKYSLSGVTAALGRLKPDCSS